MKTKILILNLITLLSFLNFSKAESVNANNKIPQTKSGLNSEPKKDINSPIEYTVQNGDVNFTAIGKPGFLKIKGESKGKSPVGKISINQNQASGEFEFSLNDLDTGISMRNEHMKDKYLEISKYPTAKLVIESLPLENSELTKDFKSEFSGKLTLHGISQNVKGHYEYNSKNNQILTQFNIKVSDFNIDIPKYLGVTVSESVDLEVKVQIAKK